MLTELVPFGQKQSAVGALARPRRALRTGVTSFRWAFAFSIAWGSYGADLRAAAPTARWTTARPTDSRRSSVFGLEGEAEGADRLALHDPELLLDLRG